MFVCFFFQQLVQTWATCVEGLTAGTAHLQSYLSVQGAVPVVVYSTCGNQYDSAVTGQFRSVDMSFSTLQYLDMSFITEG